jgi:hypothetical protein
MTSDAATCLDALVEAVQRAGRFNPDEYSGPMAILWPDAAREWEPLLPLLRDRLPLLTLGDYDPPARTGPSYWVQCMLAGAMEEKLPDGEVPILYLPGVSKQDLRAIESCRIDLQPIAALQYQGAFFTQGNGKDWTVRALLESKDGGPGIPVGSDNDTKNALGRALLKLAHVPIQTLREQAPLRAAFFDGLLTRTRYATYSPGSTPQRTIRRPARPRNGAPSSRSASRSMGSIRRRMAN